MAKQVPPYKTGTHNGLVYYKYRNDYYVRNAPSKSGAGNSALQAHGRNAFGASSAAAALIVTAFQQHTGMIGSGDLKNRIHRVLQERLTTLRLPGEELTITDEVLASLRGLQWSERHLQSSLITGSAVIELDVEQGRFDVVIQSIVSAHLKRRARTATHFRVIAVLAALDFEGHCFETVCEDSGLLPFDNGQTGSFVLSGELTRRIPRSLLMPGLGTLCYKVEGGVAYELVEDSGFELVPFFI